MSQYLPCMASKELESGSVTTVFSGENMNGSWTPLAVLENLGPYIPFLGTMEYLSEQSASYAKIKLAIILGLLKDYNNASIFLDLIQFFVK